MDALLKEPGAATRVAEFEALTQGRYVAPARHHQAQPKARS